MYTNKIELRSLDAHGVRMMLKHISLSFDKPTLESDLHHPIPFSLLYTQAFQCAHVT